MIAAGLFGLVVAYIISYYCLVEVQQGYLAMSQLGPPQESPDPVITVELQPMYRFGGRRASLIYAPIHAIDVRLRPATWSMTIPSTWSGAEA